MKPTGAPLVDVRHVDAAGGRQGRTELAQAERLLEVARPRECLHRGLQRRGPQQRDGLLASEEDVVQSAARHRRRRAQPAPRVRHAQGHGLHGAQQREVVHFEGPLRDGDKEGRGHDGGEGRRGPGEALLAQGARRQVHEHAARARREEHAGRAQRRPRELDAHGGALRVEELGGGPGGEVNELVRLAVAHHQRAVPRQAQARWHVLEGQRLQAFGHQWPRRRERPRPAVDEERLLLGGDDHGAACLVSSEEHGALGGLNLRQLPARAHVVHRQQRVHDAHQRAPTVHDHQVGHRFLRVVFGSGGGGWFQQTPRETKIPCASGTSSTGGRVVRRPALAPHAHEASRTLKITLSRLVDRAPSSCEI